MISELKADFDLATGVTRVTRVPIEHPRSLVHVIIFDLDKQGKSSKPLPVAVAVWRGFNRVTDVISSDTQ